jgi:SAM-dependent methyltransferase
VLNVVAFPCVLAFGPYAVLRRSSAWTSTARRWLNEPPTAGSELTESTSLYGPGQSRFARHLERREQRQPDPVARALRERLLAGLRGRVIEVGAGDGRSFEHYPPDLERLLAVEPDVVARKAAVERAGAVAPPVEVVAGVAEALPAPDGSFDVAVVMGLLCSVPDVPRAVAELRRVLVRGGELRFWEHVRSANPAFRLLQRAADRLFWTRTLGGCETTRDTEAAIRAGRFEIIRIEHGFHSSSPLTVPCAPYVLGVARR